MRMPGFTAEASLYKTSMNYKLAASWAVGACGQAVIPQLRIIRIPDKDCIPGCICVSPINCPCCDIIDFPFPIDFSSSGTL